jgi:hypothetical protein
LGACAGDAEARTSEGKRQTHRHRRWGTALNDDPEGPMSLHWTLPSQDQSTVCAITYRPNDSNLDLPNLFWNNLHQILTMLVVTQANQLAGDNVSSEHPEPFIERVRILLSGTPPGRDRVLIQVSLARALALHAERHNDLAAFREIIEIDHALLPNLFGKKNSALRTLTQWQMARSFEWATQARMRVRCAIPSLHFARR